MTSMMKRLMNNEAALLEKSRLREEALKESLSNDSSSSKLVDTEPYQLLQDALVEEFDPSMTAFGVVVNADQRQESGERNNLVLSGGVLNKGLSSSFVFVGDQLNSASQMISGAMKKVDGVGETNETVSVGVARQISYGAQIVGDVKQMNNTLNKALIDIHQKIGTVGKIATSVLKTGYDVGEFGALVRRMSESNGSRPTPIEDVVGMITKRNTTGATIT